MARVELEQGTEKWLQWRRDKITASRIAQLMGLSPYGTPYQLWEEMTGRKEPAKTNDNMLYGQRMEPLIRAFWEFQTGNKYTPACYEHPEIHYLAASLDGIDCHEEGILEIKTCNREVFELAKTGNVVDYYLVQMQLQLMCVPTARYVHAIFANGIKDEKILPDNIAHIVVYPNKDLQEDILQAAFNFCKLLSSDTPPPYSDRDYIYLGNDPAFVDLEKEYIRCAGELKVAKGAEEEARKRLIFACNERNTQGDFVRIQKITREGAIDWNTLTDDYNIQDEDIESYRKKPVEYFKISTI